MTGSAAGTVAALAIVILLGVPHGALDAEIARPHLCRRFGRGWFVAFALPYLALAAAVLVAWRAAPLATLAGFLALSTWHFGAEDAGPGRPIEALARGGVSIAVPVLVHPAAFARLFGVVTATPLDGPPPWLVAAAWLWLALAAAWMARNAASRPRTVAEMVALLALFACLPPLAAFALYFVAVHAPRRVRALLADPSRAPRVATVGEAVRRALPTTGLTLLAGAALWPLYDGPPADRLLALTVQGLAALTVPHVVLDRLTAPRPRPAAAVNPEPTARRARARARAA